MFKAMWEAGLIPESAEADTGANFVATFETGKIGMQGAGGFPISRLKNNSPDIDFGVGFAARRRRRPDRLVRRRRRDRDPEGQQARGAGQASSSSGS